VKVKNSAMPVAIASGAFALVAGTGLTVSSAWLITVASTQPPILALGVSIVLVRFFGIFRAVARYGERVISHEAIFRKLTAIRVKLFKVVSSQLDSSDVAGTVKTIIDDVERAQEFYLRVRLPKIASAISLSITVLLAFWISPTSLLWILPVSASFLWLIPALTLRFLDPVTEKIEEGENTYARDISSTSHAIIEAEFFGYSSFYLDKLSQDAKYLRAEEQRNASRISLLQLLVTFSLGVTLIGISTHLWLSPEIVAVNVAMLIFLVLVGFEGYITWFPSLFLAGKNRRASRNVDLLLASERKSEKVERRTPSEFTLQLSDFAPFWQEKILAPISLTLLPGETLLISGESGIGKSTLAASLFGIAPHQGLATVGGVEIKNLASGIVAGSLQRGHIFNTTLRENLKIGDTDASDDRLIAVLRDLELDYIELGQLLGEFGRPLSGGEAKRLATARALISKAPILILDEPLEYLDHARAQRIEKRIIAHTVGRTLIVISHSPWLQYSRKLTLARE
jgi:ABC-type transport system involved in cytochrome bd biosynthesis fused ATPase/permease subunit